ncbi:MAG: MATE family efflux transporter [Prevotella sp.]|nr:MATE family efflux transporter [Prevotella sp.]
MAYQFSKYASHYRNLTYLGVPIIIGQLGNIVLSFADTLMIGHHSTQELAAAAFVNNMFTLVILLALGFSYAVTAIVGTLYGQERTGRIGEVMRSAVAANTCLAAVLTAAMTLLYLNIHRLGQPEELLPLMRPYFLIQLMSLPFVCWFNTFKQFADGITDTRLPMWVLIGGNLINIIGNWLLIYGHLGLPEMGLNGAGLSTMASRIMMAAVMVTLFFRGSRYSDYRKGWQAGRLTRSDFRQINVMGIPLALQMGMETAAFSLSSVMVGWIGTTALAAHQVMLTISQLGYMVYYGMAAAVAVRTSNFMGQHDLTAVRRSATAGFHLILLLAVAIVLPIFLFRHSMGYLFTDNADVCGMVALTIVPFMIYQFGDGLQCTYANALRGISYVRPLMWVAFVAYFVISLPLGYLFGIRMAYGLEGIWYAFPFGLTTAGVLYYLYFRQRLAQTDKN